VRGALLQRHDLEIGAGLGPLKGRIWRIGLMGDSATPANVRLCLTALGEALAAQGRSDASHAAVQAAEGHLATSGA
jgi:alanine-glyoxylate transaminase/serine-glyoxylate transaminase/serine-pyruvate transaminase